MGNVCTIVTTQADHQSKASKSGNDFQHQIFQKIISEIKDPKFMILQPRSSVYLPGNEKRPRHFSCLEIVTPIGSFIGDTDIVIFNKLRHKPVLIISCKTSVRERITQSLYYSRLYRDKYGLIPFFLITKDVKGEFGTEKKAGKARILAEHERMWVFTENIKTIGGCVKPLDSLIQEIWRVIR